MSSYQAQQTEKGWQRKRWLDSLIDSMNMNLTKLQDRVKDRGPGVLQWRRHKLGLEDFWEEGMATRSSILTWKIPWMKETGGLQSMGLQRVGHD